jgi:hypothetical protein
MYIIMYLEEVRKLEKRFLGMEIEYIPRSENQEVDDIAKRASRREAQLPGVFEERLFQPSMTLPSDNDSSNTKQLPPPPTSGAPGSPAGDHLLLAREPPVASWIVELKDFLTTSTLLEDDAEAERVARQAKLYCMKKEELYRFRPNRVALQCISLAEGQRLLEDIHAGECGHHSSSRTLVGKAFHQGFY